ncbi:hypothetical protein V498_00876, partial [Pseudogymnoascus sp. VKM F-4517 (FW-2822)]
MDPVVLCADIPTARGRIALAEMAAGDAMAFADDDKATRAAASKAMFRAQATIGESQGACARLQPDSRQFSTQEAVMSEYWKSTPKYWCKHCKIYVRDTKLEKANHDATPKHQGNLKRFLRDLHRTHENEERDKDKAKNEIARLSGLASGSSGGESSSSAFGRGPTPSVPRQQATASQLKQQASQLAELGISIPDEFRGEMAMPGQWQVTSQRLVAPEGEGEKKPEAIGFGVRKRVAEDEDEETVQAKKSKWGSAFRKHPGADTENDDLDELLSRVTAPKVDPGALETKQEPSSDTAAIPKVEAIDSSIVKAGPDEAQGIKVEPPSNELSLPTESAAVAGADVKQEEGEAVGGVVFKKRKAKPMRNK